ncbi:sulfite oxidase [Gaiella sp.]|uniref:sulfite oxidase n=1 Tax=Gaiella sp. TaxID=2663207 RepID=UPI002B814100|nr:sulfite oxidase [Gaiella sp.]HWO80326.1 sulfite oxidase [Gaiella sp.]
MSVSADSGISLEELRLAARNHAMPLEALRWPITPAGLHYLLIHYDVPLVEPGSFRLEVGGAVGQTLSLSLDELRARPSVEVAVTMECAGNGRALLEPRPISQPWLTEAVGTARWRGVPLAALLDEVEPAASAADVVFGGLDRGVEAEVEQRYERSLPLAEARGAGCVLAYEMNSAPLLPQHGFPLRLVVPGWYGMTNVKWLSSITVTEEPFAGYQVAHAYRFRRSEDEEGRPVTRMRPRSLMAPPGIPDFFTRDRVVAGGAPVVLEGRAWSGKAPIVRVEVSDDAGASWAEGDLVHDLRDPFAWSGWSFRWEPASPGPYTLCCRATDGTGEAQPLEPEWNLGGYENNAVQRVPVVVR